MPWKPKTPCPHPGCPELTNGGRCAKHRRQAERTRGSAAKRLYGHRWRVRRELFLQRNPLCVDCLAEGRTTEATDVDHEVPHNGDLELFWDEDNWRSRCHSHHSRKTATQDGGFGRVGGS